MKLVPVIISGGAGSRLWPVSRALHPKPLIKLADGRSLLQHAYLRSLSLDGVAGIVTVTNASQLWVTGAQYDAVDDSRMGRIYILEPEGRDTAAATAAATVQIAETYGEDAIICLFPADHMIADAQGFRQAVAQAAALAAGGRFVTFGITPSHPETAYGYIEVEDGDVRRFVEKPDFARAQSYVAAGNFYWNSGMFCFSARTMLALMREHCPDILRDSAIAVENAQKASNGRSTSIHLERADFARVRKMSLDYAVAERAANISLVPCEIGWTDIGSWTSFSDFHSGDADGNRIIGHAIVEDSSNSFIQSGGRLIAASGLKDMIVVDTPDALLVAHRDKAQDVKKIYESLRAAGEGVHSEHRTVAHAWGSVTVLDEDSGFLVRRYELAGGSTLADDGGGRPARQIAILAGQGEIATDGKTVSVGAGSSVQVAEQARCEIANSGGKPLVFLEIETDADDRTLPTPQAPA